MEERQPVIRVKVRRRKVKERTPPDRDERYSIIGDYRQGDGKKAVVPLILEVEKRRVKNLLIAALIPNLILIFLVLINAFAIIHLEMAQSEVYRILNNQGRLPWIEVKEVLDLGQQRLLEISFSFNNKILDGLLFIRKVYIVLEVTK